MLKNSTVKDATLVVRMSVEELLVLDARAFLSGVSRSDYVRNMVDKSWGNRLAKAHRPYVAISSSLLNISAKLLKISSRESLHDFEKERLMKTCEKLNLVLDQIMDRMVIDQEALLNADNEEEAFG
jgi:hypothetical protein